MPRKVHLMQIDFSEDPTSKYKGVPRVDQRVLDHGILPFPGPHAANEAAEVKYTSAQSSKSVGTVHMDPPHPYRAVENRSLGALKAYTKDDYPQVQSAYEKNVLKGKFEGFRF